jgi:hypothetical protein
MHKFCVQSWGKCVDGIRQTCGQVVQPYTASTPAPTAMLINTPTFTRFIQTFATRFSTAHKTLFTPVLLGFSTLSTRPTSTSTFLINFYY